MAEEGVELLLGCIADDFTGATDLANTLVRRGMRAIQAIGVPHPEERLNGADAIVVALKTRTASRQDAVSQSLAACRWLSAHGARQIYFKYCSTFDSTKDGNIGPVADALLAELGTYFTTICPAFPETGRTLYQGHLFVGDKLLSDSAMRHHPLTPMTDSDLQRILRPQTARRVGLIPWHTVRRGPAAIRSAIDGLRSTGVTYAVVDAVEDEDLLALGEAAAELKLVTGGSGAAIGLPENFRRSGALPLRRDLDSLPEAGGSGAVLSGSCSATTLRQVEVMKARYPAYRIDPLVVAQNPAAASERILEWAIPRLAEVPVLVYATAPPAEVESIQASLGAERAAGLIEGAFQHLARALVKAGVRRLVIAGGETAGAVVGALGIRALRIGAQIDPGIPATLSTGKPAIAFALKSGNFGADDFFLKALTALK
jgi:uncharacterized protein YgbK (DUF1537 family)